MFAPAEARPCSRVPVPPATPHENAVAVTGRVIEHVSIRVSGEDWSSGDDGRIWGLVVRVEDAAWNPSGHGVLEVFPLGYDPACRFFGYGREDLDEYPPDTRIWLVGTTAKDVPSDSGGAPRFLLRGYELWGPYSEELEAWDRDRFDFASFLEVARHYGSDLDPDFAFYAYYRGLARASSDSDIEAKLPFLRAIRHYPAALVRYEGIVEALVPDPLWRAELLAERERALQLQRYGEVRSQEEIRASGGIGEIDISSSGLLIGNVLVHLPAPLEEVIAALGEPTADRPSRGSGNRRIDWHQHGIHAFAAPEASDRVHSITIHLAFDSPRSKPVRVFDGDLVVDSNRFAWIDPETLERRFASPEVIERIGFEATDDFELGREFRLGTYRLHFWHGFGSSEPRALDVSTLIGEEERDETMRRRWDAEQQARNQRMQGLKERLEAADTDEERMRLLEEALFRGVFDPPDEGAAESEGDDGNQDGSDDDGAS